MAALVVVCTVSFNVYANEIPDVGTERQLNCLAQNIYHEAGSESFDGKVAVAQVTLNRANSGNFPDTICGVVHQKTIVADKAICQFSWFCSPERRKLRLNQALYDESMYVAQRVLLEFYRLPELEEALYFHNTQARPGWGLERVARIGNHIFYSSDRVVRKRSYK